MEQVVGAEVYSTEVNEVKTLLATAGATIVGIYAAAAAAVVIFGSCPTSTQRLLPTRLRSKPSCSQTASRPSSRCGIATCCGMPTQEDDGTVRLEIRNEALESHYINHLALEAISHAPDARAVPADNGYAHVLTNELAPISATDRVGRDVLAPLHQLDGTAYATADEVTASVTEDDLTDTVTLTFPHPGTDSAAVALRFRSSLLTTVLLYEHMLAGQGAEALDWIGQDMASIGSVVEFGEYYLRRLGLRIEIEEDGAFREVGRIAEAGPIAWAERAVVVPVPEGDVLRVRLRFLSDGWRIDRATLATDVQTHPTQTVPLARATLDDGQRMTRVETQLARLIRPMRSSNPAMYSRLCSSPLRQLEPEPLPLRLCAGLLHRVDAPGLAPPTGKSTVSPDRLDTCRSRSHMADCRLYELSSTLPCSRSDDRRLMLMVWVLLPLAVLSSCTFGPQDTRVYQAEGLRLALDIRDRENPSVLMGELLTVEPDALHHGCDARDDADCGACPAHADRPWPRLWPDLLKVASMQRWQATAA